MISDLKISDLGISEVATILAGLRLLQDELIESGIEAVKHSLPQFNDVAPMNVDSIDLLCEKINCP